MGRRDDRIFDAHLHAGNFPAFNVSADRASLIQTMETCAISGGVVFSPDNSMVRALVDREPRLLALAWINPKTPDYLDEAGEYLAHPRFVGIKLHPLLDGFHPDDPAVHPLMEALIAADLPALVHCGHPPFSLPWSIEELAVRFPAAKIILGHMGHGNIVYINAAIDVAARNNNVFLETSGMPMHTKIAEAVDRAGADRVLYGSDFPFHHPEVEIRKVELSGLRPDAVDRVLGANARRLFRTPDKEAT